VGRTRTIAVFVALLLAGCAIGPDNAWAQAKAPAQAPAAQAPAAQAPAAQAPAGTKVLHNSEIWSAWEVNGPGGKLCYVSARPASTQTKPPGVKRGEVYVTVTHRIAATSQLRDEVSFHAGYPIKADRNVGAAIDKTKTFDFSRRAPATPELIWSQSPETDRALIAAMRSGRELVLTGTSQRGTTTVDVFKLDGFAKAMDAANKACGPR
jgi:invasion protein IalB